MGDLQADNLRKQIFSVSTNEEFERLALRVFKYQAKNNQVFKEYLSLIGKSEKEIDRIEEIIFLPVSFFKSHKVISSPNSYELEFKSSGTTDSIPSTHYVTSKQLYDESFLKTFTMFYGEPSEYCIIALLPSYMERGNSSLVYMVKSLINLSKHPDSNFYLSDLDLLTKKLIQLDKSGQKTILFGVSFALLDLFERSKMDLRNTIIIETGGMKGRRKELTREELHNYLKVRSGCTQIHSEYGMTELLSQAYSQSDGEFIPPPWMKILIRDPYDPFTLLSGIKTGGLNVIDLANLNSCAFIETSDLGRILPNGKFEVLGRFDNSELRGCNLMIQ